MEAIAEELEEEGVGELGYHGLEDCQDIATLVFEICIHVHNRIKQLNTKPSLKHILKLLKIINRNPLQHNNKITPKRTILLNPNNNNL